jgi:hypothetical protein
MSQSFLPVLLVLLVPPVPLPHAGCKVLHEPCASCPSLPQTTNPWSRFCPALSSWWLPGVHVPTCLSLHV